MRSIVLSDVHLGATCSNAPVFAAFLNSIKDEHFNHVIVIGDLVDFWRTDSAKTLEGNIAILRALRDLHADHSHYVIGNHDYSILGMASKYGWNPVVSKGLHITEGGHKFYFTHGYDMDVFLNMENLPLDVYEAFSEAMCHADSTIGGIASNLWDILSISASDIRKVWNMLKNPHKRKNPDSLYKFSTSGAAHWLYGLDPTTRLVFGHTHRPFINKTHTVANTGSWCTDPGCSFTNTYVDIRDGEMGLKRYLVERNL